MQIRDDEVTKNEEFEEFVRYSELDKNQFTILNVFDTPEFESDIIAGYDALFVGGSSDASVIQPEKYPFVESSKKLIKYCADNSIPVFASCFGFQCVTEALGKKVIVDEENMEMGTYPIKKTEEANKDLLFHDIPDGFQAVSGHRERAESIPDGAILLASSEKCPIHAIKLKDKPFYATQFHPEVDDQDLIARITRYVDRYYSDESAAEELRQIAENAKPTPDSNSLIKKFVDRVLLGEDTRR